MKLVIKDTEVVDYAEERRLFYVALTRTKNRVFVITPVYKPSQFILEIIDKFKNTKNTKFGFFVMGGAFSEGIDLIGDALNGVIVVGVGLPMVCSENDILKDHFQLEYGKGFEYAYQYPGFTKVIQAVGRVIRDKMDKGIAILMDERFTYSSYLALFPPHWKNKKVITNTYLLKKELFSFYNK